jgi:hypothetical protein
MLLIFETAVFASFITSKDIDLVVDVVDVVVICGLVDVVVICGLVDVVVGDENTEPIYNNIRKNIIIYYILLNKLNKLL